MRSARREITRAPIADIEIHANSRAMPLSSSPKLLAIQAAGAGNVAFDDEFAQGHDVLPHACARMISGGRVPDERLYELYLSALGVYYGPFDEDYGYVTIEGFAAPQFTVARLIYRILGRIHAGRKRPRRATRGR